MRDIMAHGMTQPFRTGPRCGSTQTRPNTDRRNMGLGWAWAATGVGVGGEWQRVGGSAAIGGGGKEWRGFERQWQKTEGSGSEWHGGGSEWPGHRVEEQGTWASRTRKRSEAGCGRPEDGGVWTATVKQPRQQPPQPPIRQLLGAADAQTAHHATSSTAPAHQLLGSANAETTPAGAPAAAADRTQRPNATCEGKNG